MPKLSEGGVVLGGLAIFAIWIFAVLPWLYGPPPRFAETSRPPQAHSEQTRQDRAQKPDGSENAPFFVRIPKTAEERAQEAQERQEKSSTDWWLMVFTGAVAIFTLVLAIVGGSQTWQLKRTVDSAEQAIVTTESAYVFAGIGGTGVIRRVSDQRVLGVLLSVSVVNYGKTPGFITEIEWDVTTDDELPPIENTVYRNRTFVGWTISPGRKGQLSMPLASLLPQPSSCIFFGRVWYETIFHKSPGYSEFAHRVYPGEYTGPEDIKSRPVRVEAIEGRDAYARSRKAY